MEQTITLTVDDQELVFIVRPVDHNTLIDAMTPTNKIAPMHNFVVRTVAPDSESALMDLLGPGVAVQIATALLEEYTPKLEISVKKPKPSSKRSGATS